MKTAIYDLGVAPVTFDICHFLVAAKAAGAEHVDIWPGPHLGFRDDEAYMFQAQADKESRLDNILLPCVRLAGLGVTYRTTRPRPELVPTPCDLGDAIRTGLPEAPLFRAPDAAKQWVARWLRARGLPQNPVVVALRRSIYEPRNSNEDAWLRLAAEVNAVVIPDATDVVREPGPDDNDFRLAGRVFDGINLGRRLALYETASVVTGIGAGHMEFAWLSNHIPYIVWMPVHAGWVASTPQFMTRQGLPPGSNFPWASPRQTLVWEPDSYESISREYKAWKSRSSS